MDVPAIGARSGGEHGRHGAGRQVTPDTAAHSRAMRALRARWRTASLASGWRFPNDWALPEVDAVCAAVLRAGGPEHALAGLGRARATAGAGLGETLMDLAALHAVLEQAGSVDGFVSPDVDATPSRLLRVTAVGWADVAVEQSAGAGVVDPLTSLPTTAYLLTRLGELYRQAERDERAVAERHTLLVVAMDFTRAAGWSRLTGMILAADALKSVFDGGESLAVLGPSTAAALVPRDNGVAARAVFLRRELTERLAVDNQLCQMGSPRLKLWRLPATHEQARQLLDRLRRA